MSRSPHHSIILLLLIALALLGMSGCAPKKPVAEDPIIDKPLQVGAK